MQTKNKNGFTLIELLVVVLIIGVLTAVALPQYSTAVEKARSAEALSLMNAVAGSAERYCFQMDKWPNNMSQLDIEVPKSSADNSDGGKNFSIAFSSGGNTDCTVATNKLIIQATRRDLTGDSGYSLTTELVLDPDTETVNATRKCTYTGSGKGKTYCDSITNGHNENF